MKKINTIWILILISGLLSCEKEQRYFKVSSSVPDLNMPGNHLNFKEIEDYKNYKIVATHFRTDKDELRYILANEKAFSAFTNNTDFPYGSKIVKIGWSTKKMSNFSPAIEQDSIRRIEYMIKRSDFKNNPGSWGYARFVNKKGVYKSWDQGTESCVNCHNLAKDNEYVFSVWALKD